MKTLGLALALCLPTVSVLAQTTPVTPLELSELQMAVVLSGGHLESHEAGQRVHAEIIGLLHSPVQTVFDTIMDFDHEDEWFPDERNTRIVRVEDGRTYGRGETNMPWPITDREWEVFATTADETLGGVECKVIRYQYVEGTGNLDAMDGHWLLVPYGDNAEWTILRYVIDVDIGVALPRAVVTWGTTSVLPNMVENLDAQAQAR